MGNVIIYFFASRFTFFIFSLLAPAVLVLQNGYLGREINKNVPYLSWIWANFDGVHYLNIATLGYKNFDFAFFPLYPLLINLVSRVIPISSIYLGISISLVAFFLAIFVVYKIILIDFDERVARLSLFFLTFFPVAFFYQAVYADSLFLLLSTSSLYFARKNKWAVSGVFGMLSVLCRFSGLALIPALVFEWYFQNKKIYMKGLVIFNFLRSAFIAILLTGSGLIFYMIYLQVNFGDFLIFQKSFSAWDQAKFTFPLQTIVRYFKIFTSVDKNLLVYWIAVLELVSFTFYLILSAYTFKKIRWSYGVFMILLLFLVSFTGTLAGTPRYILHLFPGSLAMALLLRKHIFLKNLAIIACLLLGFILTALFTRGYFVT